MDPRVFDKFAAFDVQQLLNPRDQGHERAKNVGGVLGGLSGSAIVGRYGPAAVNTAKVMPPKLRALASLLLAVGGIGTIGGGVAGGRALGGAIRPEKSKWKLLGQSL